MDVYFKQLDAVLFVEIFLVLITLFQVLKFSLNEYYPFLALLFTFLWNFIFH